MAAHAGGSPQDPEKVRYFQDSMRRHAEWLKTQLWGEEADSAEFRFEMTL